MLTLKAIAARYGVLATQKAAMQKMTILGALSGALVSLVLMQPFQVVARAHFTVRRREHRSGH